MKSHSEQTPHTKDPESVEPQQWVVVKGQCVPMKQEHDDNTDTQAIKQENHDLEVETYYIFDDCVFYV